MSPTEQRRRRGGPGHSGGTPPVGGTDPASIRANHRRLKRKQKIARRRAAAFGAFSLLAVLFAALAVLALDRESGISEGLDPRPEPRDAPELDTAPVAPEQAGGSAGAAERPPQSSGLSGAAYASLSGQVEGVLPEDVEFAQVSLSDPDRAAVWFPAPEREGRERHSVFFAEREGEGWRLTRSVLAGDQEFPKDLKTLLTGEPEDLVAPIFAEEALRPQGASGGPEELAERYLSTATEARDWRAASVDSEGDRHAVRLVREGDEGAAARVYVAGDGAQSRVVGAEPEGAGALTQSELPGFPRGLVPEGTPPPAEEPSFAGAEAVYAGGARGELEGRGVEQAVEVVERYPGVVGFYALDLEDGSGFGVRPDEEFFSASTIKVAVMAAVYRKIDAGELDYSDGLVTTEEDWAAGAGWLRWETPGAKATVEDALWLMMTESDNVATNVLLRTVGGPEYVNSVSRDLGAEETVVFWKLTSERAAVPELDNHTTPRDMTELLAGIHEGRGFTDYARREMVDLMGQNNLEYWLEGGIPQDVKAANKGGWLDGTYNDVGIVRYEDGPYALAIYTMNGPPLEEGQGVLSEVSKAVWLARSGETKEESDRAAGSDSAPRENAGEGPGNSPEGRPSGERPQRPPGD